MAEARTAQPEDPQSPSMQEGGSQAEQERAKPHSKSGLELRHGQHVSAGQHLLSAGSRTSAAPSGNGGGTARGTADGAAMDVEAKCAEEGEERKACMDR